MSSLYLAQVVGLYLIIGGGIIMMRRNYLIPVVGTFIEERLLRFMWASVEIIVGLFFVLGFQEWATTYESILSILGWMFLIEGILYLSVPDKYVKKFIKMVNTRPWYVVGGLLSLVVGAYLAGIGFDLL